MKKHKALHIENVLSINEKTSINDILVDDCLIYIFEQLPNEERLKVEKVSKRWQEIGKRSWSKTNTFFVNSETFPIAKSVILRSGNYLNCISFNNINPPQFDNTIFLKAISETCQNLLEINLRDTLISTVKHFTDDNLGLIFDKNKKLSKISLNDTILNGRCLLNLCADSITEVNMKMFEFKSKNRLYEFLSKLKNLEKFYSCSCKNDGLMMIKALDESNCQNIKEFSFNTRSEKLRTSYVLSKLISKQKKMFKCKLINFFVNKNFINCLPAEELQELCISFYDGVPDNFNIFKNVTSLECTVRNLTDTCIWNLAKCMSSLKKIVLCSNNCFLTSEGENYFSFFQNLENLGLNLIGFNIDNILKALVECKKLEILDVTGYSETCYGEINNLNLFSNLKTLKIENTDFSYEKRIDLIYHLIKLEHLYIGMFEKIQEFLQMASTIKTFRGDKSILNVYVLENKLFVYQFSPDEYPLISIISESYFDKIMDNIL